MNQPKVINVAIKGLIHDQDNPNKMSTEDFGQLVANIKASGAMLQPILIQETDEGYKIVDGHHRTRGAEEAGLTHVLAVLWDGTEEMRKAVAIGFNKIRGELDLAGVQRTLSELAEAGWSSKEMTVTGYSKQEIDDLLKVAIEVDPDAIMEHPTAMAEEPAPAQETGTFALEVTFTTRTDLNRAKKALRSFAGKGNELGAGLLALLDQIEKEE